jgi:hypothetical protein
VKEEKDKKLKRKNAWDVFMEWHREQRRAKKKKEV